MENGKQNSIVENNKKEKLAEKRKTILGLVRVTKTVVWTMVGAGIIYGGIQAISLVISKAKQLPSDVLCVSVGVLIGLVVAAFLGVFTPESDTPPTKIVDLTGFSGGHVGHSVSVAPSVDDDSNGDKH